MSRLVNVCASAALLTPLVVAAAVGLRAAGIGRGDARRLPGVVLAAYALAVAGAGILSALGVLGFGGMLVWAWGAAAAAWFAARRILPVSTDPEPAAAGVAALDWAGLAAVCVVYASAAVFFTDRPVYDQDALTYHLHFAAQWLVDGRVSIVETPFGDAAPAYAPSHGSLWYAWWMAPWRGAVVDVARFRFNGVDAIVKYAGLPFAALLAASVRLIALRLGADAAHSLRPAWLVLLVPWVVTQSFVPGADLIMGSCLVAAVAFAADYRSRPSAASAALTGLALGLALGTKFLAVVYAPLTALAVFLLVFRKATARHASVFAVAAGLAALPWYLRNGIVTGNPIFPAQVEALGRVVFPGAYVRAAMTRSGFHVPSMPAALVVAGHAVGYALAPLALLGVALGLGRAVRDPGWRAVAWLAPAGFALHFLAVPYSSQDRFLIGFTALAFPALAFPPAGRTARRALEVLIGLCAATALLAPVLRTEWAGAPVVLAGLLSLSGGGSRLSLVICVAAAAVIVTIGRRGGFALTTTFATATAAAILVASIGSPFFRFSLAGLRELPLAAYVELWRARPAVTAYTGRNRPFHLAGRDGRTRVVSVPTDGRADTPFHAVIAENRAAGTLDPMRDKDDWRGRALGRGAWRAALLAKGVEYLLIESLSIEERRYLRYDEDGFPIERGWARAEGALFRAVRTGPEYELYRVTRP